MYSILIEIAIDASRAVELVDTITMLGSINAIVGVIIAYLDPNNISVIINNTLFF